VRLEEKEQVLSKKSKQVQDLSDEKSTLAGEIRDMKDMLDVKERKVAVLQKKVRGRPCYLLLSVWNSRRWTSHLRSCDGGSVTSLFVSSVKSS